MADMDQHIHGSLLIKLKKTVEGLLAGHSAQGVWSTYGGLRRVCLDTEAILCHGMKDSQTSSESGRGYWNFIQGLKWLCPSMASIIDKLTKRRSQSQSCAQSGREWLQESVQEHSFIRQLDVLLGHKEHLHSFYHPSAFLCQDQYIQAVRICFKAIELNKPALLSDIDPLLLKQPPKPQVPPEPHLPTGPLSSSLPHHHHHRALLRLGNHRLSSDGSSLLGDAINTTNTFPGTSTTGNSGRGSSREFYCGRSLDMGSKQSQLLEVNYPNLNGSNLSLTVDPSIGFGVSSTRPHKSHSEPQVITRSSANLDGEWSSDHASSMYTACTASSYETPSILPLDDDFENSTRSSEKDSGSKYRSHTSCSGGSGSGGTGSHHNLALLSASSPDVTGLPVYDDIIVSEATAGISGGGGNREEDCKVIIPHQEETYPGTDSRLLSPNAEDDDFDDYNRSVATGQDGDDVKGGNLMIPSSSTRETWIKQNPESGVQERTRTRDHQSENVVGSGSCATHSIGNNVSSIRNENNSSVTCAPCDSSNNCNDSSRKDEEGNDTVCDTRDCDNSVHQNKSECRVNPGQSGKSKFNDDCDNDTKFDGARSSGDFGGVQCPMKSFNAGCGADVSHGGALENKRNNDVSSSPVPSTTTSTSSTALVVNAPHSNNNNSNDVHIHHHHHHHHPHHPPQRENAFFNSDYNNKTKEFEASGGSSGSLVTLQPHIPGSDPLALPHGLHDPPSPLYHRHHQPSPHKSNSSGNLNLNNNADEPDGLFSRRQHQQPSLESSSTAPPVPALSSSASSAGAIYIPPTFQGGGGFIGGINLPDLNTPRQPTIQHKLGHKRWVSDTSTIQVQKLSQLSSSTSSASCRSPPPFSSSSSTAITTATTSTTNSNSKAGATSPGTGDQTIRSLGDQDSYHHGTLTRPLEGQSLISYLISQDFNTCANMEKENAHFHISEALIAAFESVQWNRTMRKCDTDLSPSSSSSSSSDEEIQQLRQRIRIRKREKMMERGRSFPSVSDDAQDGQDQDLSPPNAGSPQGSGSEDGEDTKEVDLTLSGDGPSSEDGATVTNLEALTSKGLNLSMASLYSVVELQKSNQQVQQRTLSHEESSLTAGSAESVAISLLKKFSEKQLPKASELKWLVSERDAPQQLLPLPSSIPVSPDDAENRDIVQSTNQTRLRGNMEWAPPRSQIIFSIHPPEKRAVVLARQNNRCAGCGTRVDPAYAKRYRYCEYLGKYFCQCCHSNETSIIPGRVIERWDFTRYTISNFSYHLLGKMWSEALFHVDNVNPGLYRRVKTLDSIRHGRQQLTHLQALLAVCKRDAKLLKEIQQLPHHWTENDNVYSMDDFNQVKNGLMLTTIKALVTAAKQHVAECQLCQGLGFICGLCDDKRVIFPFQLKTVVKCPVCQTCYHKHCFVVGKCPKCIRMEARRKQQQEPMSPMSPDSSPEWDNFSTNTSVNNVPAPGNGSALEETTTVRSDTK